MELVYDTVSLDEEKDALVIVDQTQLPGKIEMLSLTEIEDIWEAIYLLKVRGAPAIGVNAAIGVYLAVKDADTTDMEEFKQLFAKAKDYLATSRPTAVNLFWALDRMASVVDGHVKYYGIPLYVCAPTSTIDMTLSEGGQIPIEERSPEEITEMWYDKRMAPAGVKVYNPCFDVTDHELIAGIVTEYGVLRAPYEDGLKELFEKI